MKKTASTVRSLPHPAIEEGNFSFPDGDYKVQTELPDNAGGQGTTGVILHHQITGAPFIERLLASGEAKYACLVSASKTGYRRLHIADAAEQQISWDLAVVGEPPMLGPLVLYVGDRLRHTFTAQDGVAEVWQGKSIDVPKGMRLARCSYLRPSASIARLITVRPKQDMQPGSFTVKDNSNEGFYFNLDAAPDIFRFLQNPQEKKALRASILTHATSQCFNILKNEYKASGEEADEGNGWEQHSNLRALADWLASKNMPHWSDDGFDAVETATRLYPIKIPDHDGDVMRYQAFDGAGYTSLRKGLLKEKGGTLQRALLTAARDSENFVAWIEERVYVGEAGEQLEIGDERLSEGEYRELPWTMETALFDKWDGVTPAQASEETFWGYMTLTHIKQGLIESCFLATNGGNGGLARIDKALGDGNEKSIDDVTRTILRRLGGLPEARGKRSVYVDCPFARAWWRGYVAREVCEETGAEFKGVMRTLAISQAYWEKLILLIVSRNSVLGDSKVRSALICILSERLDDESRGKLFTSETIETISRQIGIRSAWQELGAFSISDLKQLMEQDFLRNMNGG